MVASKINLRTRLSKGTYPRLYVPIMLLILLAVLTRYHFLIASEVKEAQERWVTEINRVGFFLLPELRRAPGDAQAIQRKLDETLQFTPGLASMSWQAGAFTVTARSPALPLPAVPQWFASLAHTERTEKQFSTTLADGQQAVFTVAVWPDASLANIWGVVASQISISALNIVTILAALTLLLRANARMLSRLSNATVAFQSGNLDTRMEVKGTLEVKAVAETFNAMATQIQQLITSLQNSESEQADQLYFTRQLVNAFPLPVFVRSARDICLVVNPAWERMFGIPAEVAVGNPMSSEFDSLEDNIIDITTAEEEGSLKVAKQEVHRFYVNGETRYMLYFRAPFFNRGGAQLGTIATLVDVTDREPDNRLSLWADNRSGLPSVH